jgi:cell division protein FtsB
MLDQTGAVLSVLLGMVALLGAAAGWLRWVRPRLSVLRAKFVQATDSLIGREEQRDSITGRVIAPALPGIGVRMENVERSIESIATLLKSQHTQDQRLDALEHRNDAIEHRVQQLEDGTIERIAAKAESVAAWRAVEFISKQGDINDVTDVEDHCPPEIEG